LGALLLIATSGPQLKPGGKNLARLVAGRSLGHASDAANGNSSPPEHCTGGGKLLDLHPKFRQFAGTCHLYHAVLAVISNPRTQPNYDNPYFHDNVYGHALALLARAKRQGEGTLYLDIGCGYGRIAEPLVGSTGLHYVGLDIDDAGLKSLQERGFETHHVDLVDEGDRLYEEVVKIIGGRAIGFLGFLDTLEHLPNGDAILRVIGRLAREHACYVIVSTPNVAHADIGFKLAFGHWNYTDKGLLDHTHVRLFNNGLFEAALNQAGLYPIDRFDVESVISDQHFPADHPALARGTELHSVLVELRATSDEFSYTYQFVRLCVAGPCLEVLTHVLERETERPFLTVVTRTEGKRLHTLAEALLCLTGQTDQDFEVIVVGHCLTEERRRQVERVIDDTPAWLRAKIRLERVEGGNRTHPLNVGFELARGRYIAVLDDDDIPFANWVEVFRKLDEKSPGKVLRASNVRQDVDNVTIGGRIGLRAEVPPQRVYPSTFDYLDHLRTNQSPPVSLAFPRGVFHDLNIRFDETLTTTEDWDYLLRVAGLVGVASASEVTSLYRWWPRAASSRTEHCPDEWRLNRERILQKTDSAFIFFPKGTAQRIRCLLDSCDRFHGQSGVLDAHYADLREIKTTLLPLVAKKDAENYGPTNRLERAWRSLIMRVKYLKTSKARKRELQVIRNSPLFDRYWYTYFNPEVTKFGWDPVLHFLIKGAVTGRSPGPYFNIEYYLQHNPDVIAGGMNPLAHYELYGLKEGREIRPANEKRIASC